MCWRKREDRGKEKRSKEDGMERVKEREIDETLRERKSKKKRLRSFGT